MSVHGMPKTQIHSNASDLLHSVEATKNDQRVNGGGLSCGGALQGSVGRLDQRTFNTCFLLRRVVH